MKINMPKDKGFLYDSADVYWPSGKKKGYKTFDEAIYHLRYLLEWLDKKKLLNEEARKYLEEDSLPKNFKLWSWMLDDNVNKKIPSVYDKWADRVKPGEKVNMDILEKALNFK